MHIHAHTCRHQAQALNALHLPLSSCSLFFFLLLPCSLCCLTQERCHKCSFTAPPNSSSTCACVVYSFAFSCEPQGFMHVYVHTCSGCWLALALHCWQAYWSYPPQPYFVLACAASHPVLRTATETATGRCAAADGYLCNSRTVKRCVTPKK